MNSVQLSTQQLKQKVKNRQSEPLVLLETGRPDKENKNSFLFTDCRDILTFDHNDDLPKFFQRLEQYLQKGFWLAGYFTYEFGYFLEEALRPLRRAYKFPLVWLGVFGQPQRITPPRAFTPKEEKLSYSIKNIKPTISRAAYAARIKKIKNFLEAGLTYQVNFTFKLNFDFSGSPLDFYLNLRRAQPTAYMAFINTGRQQVLSLSPELFFRIDGATITSRPMKGTAARGRSLAEDKKNRTRLKKSVKTRAENLMIVDLLRNDLGRVAKRVTTPRLFEVEKHKTLYQMTSTIQAQGFGSASFKDIFCSLFPCGSVTGAPKIKTMQLIKDLEAAPRGIYTGSVGYISPQRPASPAGRQACFNVAIRTACLKNGRGHLGVGGGIVYDSEPGAEYQEALLKGRFMTERFVEFALIETILWEKDKGFFLLDRHLQRLKLSSHYFSIPFKPGQIKKQLASLAKNLDGPQFKIRLTVDSQGRSQVTRQALEKLALPVKVVLSPKRIDPAWAHLYHKTTRRALYDRTRQKAQAQGFFEVLFFNIHDQASEGAASNIFVLKDGCLYTPPLASGLLPGVLRAELLRQGRAREKTLYLKDILEADKFYIGNSVRGLLEARLQRP